LKGKPGVAPGRGIIPEPEKRGGRLVRATKRQEKPRKTSEVAITLHNSQYLSKQKTVRKKGTWGYLGEKRNPLSDSVGDRPDELEAA